MAEVKKKTRRQRTTQMVIAVIALIGMVFAFQAWRGSLQSKRKKIDTSVAKSSAYEHALLNPLNLGTESPIGRFKASIISAQFLPDLQNPETHKYVIAQFDVTNPKSTPLPYQITCQAVSNDAHAYVTAVLPNDFDINDPAAVDKIKNDPTQDTDTRSGTISAGAKLSFKLVSDVEDSAGPHQMICEVNKKDNTVVSWKLVKVDPVLK